MEKLEGMSVTHQRSKQRRSRALVDAQVVINLLKVAVAKVRQASTSVQELLPGIEDFLSKDLAKEKLSSLSERKRLYYVERLDVLKLPPTLPPRPEGEEIQDGGATVKPNLNSSPDTFLAHQRELSRTQQNGSNFDDGEEYDAVESPLKGDGEFANGMPGDDDLYEVPMGQDAQSDGEFSSEGTSYESYDDEESAPPVYENQEFHNQTKEKSRTKSRKKKKKSEEESAQEAFQARNLNNVTYGGELFQKWKLGKWMKRYCIIFHDNKFCVYKNDKETKAIHTLRDYDAIYLEREGKRNYVIRISHPTSETLWFSAESKNLVDYWLVLLGGSLLEGQSIFHTDTVNRNGSSPPPVDNQPATQVSSPSTTNLSLTSGSEGGSGDGVVNSGSPVLPMSPSESKGGEDAKAAEKRKGGNTIMDSISSFFTIGKRKGEKFKKMALEMEEREREKDPEAVVGGYVNVLSDLCASKKWVRRYLHVKHGILESFRDSGEESGGEVLEFQLPLSGMEIQAANEGKKGSLAVKLMLEGKEKVILDYAEPLEQGTWLSALIKETGVSTDPGGVMDYVDVDGENEYEGPDDIYDEVCDDKRTFLSFFSGKDGSGSQSSGSSGRMTMDEPPPLPDNPPPKVPPSFIRTENGMSFRAPEDKPSIKRGRAARRSLPSRASLGCPPQPPGGVQRQESFGSSGSRTPPTGRRGTDASDDGDVIKCHQGPTIELDKELLETTENPILSQLRRDRSSRRSYRPSDKEKIQDNLSAARKKLAQTRKKRAEIRAKKLLSTDSLDRRAYEVQLKKLDRDFLNMEEEVKKYMIEMDDFEDHIFNEGKSSLEKADSLCSTTSSTSSSLTSPAMSPARKANTFPSATRGSSDTNNPPKSKSTISSFSSTRTTGTSRGRTGSPSATRSTATVSGSKPFGEKVSQVKSKWDLDSNSTTVTKVTKTSVTRGGKSSVSATSTQRITTSSRSSPGRRLTTEKEDSGDDVSSPRGGRRKPVQERLKLWESLSSTSTC